MEPADDDFDPGRHIDPGHGVWDVTAVPVGYEQEVSLRCAGCAPADVGEVVGPGIDELQHVVPVVRIGHVQDQRATTQIQRGDQIEGVVVRRDELGRGVQELPNPSEAVPRHGRPEDGGLARRQFLDLIQVVHKRVAVDEGPRCRRDYLGVDQRDLPQRSGRTSFGERNSHAPSPTPLQAAGGTLCAPEARQAEVLVDRWEARGDPPTSVAFICIG